MLPSKIKMKIKKNGLIHYTNKENSKKIISSNSIGNANSNVYFFLNEPIALDVLCYNLRYVDSESGKRLIDTKPLFSSIAGKDTVVIINNLTDSQIKYLKYDFSNEAIIFPNRFDFSQENQIFIENADFRSNPKTSKNKVFKVMKSLFFRKGQLDKLHLY